MALESEGTALDINVILKGVSAGLSDPDKGMERLEQLLVLVDTERLYQAGIPQAGAFTYL